MYNLTKIKDIKEAIEVLALMDGILKFYWIDSLKLCKAEKGYLIKYFNL